MRLAFTFKCCECGSASSNRQFYLRGQVHTGGGFIRRFCSLECLRFWLTHPV